MIIIFFILSLAFASNDLAQVEPFIREWERNHKEFYSQEERDRLSISVGKLDTGIAGVCVTINVKDILSRKRTVTFSEDFFKRKPTGLEIRALVSHELMHCLCDALDHDDRKFVDGCPVSMLNTYTVSHQCLAKHYDDYNKDMRLKCSKKQSKH